MSQNPSFSSSKTSSANNISSSPFPPRGKNKRPNLGYKHDLLCAFGEFLGTAIFLFLALGGTNFARPDPFPLLSGSMLMVVLAYDFASASQYFYVAFSQGLALISVAILFVRISGSVFNPAISLACFFAGTLHFTRTMMEFIAQFAGAIAGTYLLAAVLPSNIVVNTVLANETTIVEGLFLEAILTGILCFTALMLPLHIKDTNIIGPVVVGLTLISVELVAAPLSGGGVNPARVLSAAIVANHWDRYDWLYFVGPFLGSWFGAMLYGLVQYIEHYAEKVKPKDQKLRREETNMADEKTESTESSEGDISPVQEGVRGRDPTEWNGQMV